LRLAGGYYTIDEDAENNGRRIAEESTAMDVIKVSAESKTSAVAGAIA
jgi:hypothetical protein